MSKISVLIVDNDKETVQELSNYIKIQSDITIAGIANNSEDALLEIQKTKPDVLFLDLVVPSMDCINVLKEIDTMFLTKIPRIILYSSSQVALASISSIVHTNIDFCLLKPQKCEYVCNIIRTIMTWRNKPQYDIKRSI